MLLSEFNTKKSNRKVIEIHEESPTSPEINRGGHNKLRNKEDYLDKRDVLFRLLSQSDTDPETKAKARERLLDLEKAAKSAGIIGEDESRENPVAAAIARRIMTQHVDLLSKHGAEKVIAAIDDVAEFVGDVEEIGSSDVSGWVREVERNLQSMGTRESAESGVTEGIMDTIKGAAKELTRDSLQRKIKQAWENTFWPKHIEPALNRIQINGQPFRRMVLGEPRVIENKRSQRAILKQYTVDIVFPIDPRQWAGDEIQYLEGQLQDIQDGDWNPKVHGLGLVNFDQPMKSFQYTRGETPDLVIPVRITSLDINRGLVGEQGVAEMDSQGYRGHRGDEDPGKGPEKVVKPAKSKDVAKDTEKELTKAMDKAHKKGVAEGAFSEIDIELHNIARSGDEEELIDALGGLKGGEMQIALEDMMEDLADQLAAKGMNHIINDHDKMIELLWDKIVDEYGDAEFNEANDEANDDQPYDDHKPKFTGVPKRPDSYPEIKNTKVLPPAPGRPRFVGKPQQKTNESLRTGEYHVATVTFADGTEKKVKIRSDEGFRDPIIKHFAQQGQTVKDITVDWSVRADENNDRPLSFVVPAKNTNLGYIKLIVHKIKNNKPVSRQEKEDLNKYLASNLMSEEDHGDLRTGWVVKAAKRAFPMAATDEEALAMWINDRVEKDVDRLDRDNDREDRDIDRLDKENDQEQRMLSQMNSRDEQIEKKIADLQSQVDVLYKSNEGRKPSALESRLCTRATAKEVSKYIAEMKKAGYDI